MFWTLVVVAGLYLVGGVLPQNRSSVPSTTGPPEPALPSYESVYRKCEDSLVSVNVKPRQYLAVKKDIFDCLLVTPHRPPSADEAQRMKEWWEGVEIAAGRQRD